MVDALPVGDHSAYLGAVRRMIRAAGRRVGDGDPLDLLELDQLREALDAAVRDAARAQNAAGHSWRAIGDPFGMTKQGAQQRWRP